MIWHQSSVSNFLHYSFVGYEGGGKTRRKELKSYKIAGKDGGITGVFGRGEADMTEERIAHILNEASQMMKPGLGMAADQDSRHSDDSRSPSHGQVSFLFHFSVHSSRVAIFIFRSIIFRSIHQELQFSWHLSTYSRCISSLTFTSRYFYFIIYVMVVKISGRKRRY